MTVWDGIHENLIDRNYKFVRGVLESSQALRSVDNQLSLWAYLNVIARLILLGVSRVRRHSVAWRAS